MSVWAPLRLSENPKRTQFPGTTYTLIDSHVQAHEKQERQTERGRERESSVDYIL